MNIKKNVPWSPLAVEMLLHYHCSPDAHPQITNPVHLQAVHDWCLVGALEEEDDDADDTGRYSITSRGRALVTMICNTPLPEARFVDPRTLTVVGDE